MRAKAYVLHRGIAAGDARLTVLGVTGPVRELLTVHTAAPEASRADEVDARVGDLGLGYPGVLGSVDAERALAPLSAALSITPTRLSWSPTGPKRTLYYLV